MEVLLARLVGSVGPVVSGFHHLAEQRTVAVRSFRRSGEPVDTPVWSVVSDGVLYFGTPAHTHKVARIRRNPAVEVAPCDSRGRIEGAWTRGSAHFLTEAEFAVVQPLIDRRHRLAALAIRLVSRLRRWDYIGLGVTAPQP